MRGGQQPAGGRPLCHTFSIIQFWSQLAWRGKLPLPKLCCPGRAAVPAPPAAAGVRTARSLQSHLSNSQGAALSFVTLGCRAASVLAAAWVWPFRALSPWSRWLPAARCRWRAACCSESRALRQVGQSVAWSACYTRVGRE